MPAQSIKRPDNQEVYAHVYNKGIEGRVIFNDKQDYEVFTGFLKDYLTTPADPESTKKAFTVNGRAFLGVPHQPKNYLNKVELLAYCLTPDHWHLLLKQKTKGAIEKFIRSLCTRYSIYFNKKYQRSGTLFGGRYKSVQVEGVPSLRLLTRYFHQATSDSSYPEYLGQRNTDWVKANVVLASPKERQGYRDFVEKYGLNQAEQELLERIVFESESEHLGGEALIDTADVEPRSKTPEFVATAALFVVLMAL